MNRNSITFVATLALSHYAFAQGPAGAPRAESNGYSVMLDRVTGTSHYTPRTQYGGPTELEGVYLWLVFGVQEKEARHIIGRQPDVSITTVRDMNGQDLLAGRQASMSQDRHSETRVQFLMPGVGNEYGDRYYRDSLKATSMARVAQVPEGLSELVGEARMGVVSKDVTREFPGNKAVDAELATGVRFWIQSLDTVTKDRTGYCEIGYEIDPAKAGASAIMNAVEIRRGSTSDRLDLHGSARPDGKIGAYTRRNLDPEAVVLVHVVLETEVVTIPFHFGPVSLMVDPPENARPEMSLSSKADGYEIVVTSIGGWVGHSFKPDPYWPDAPSMGMNIGVLHEGHEVVFSREPKVTLTEVTDAKGNILRFTPAPDPGCPGCGPSLEVPRPNDNLQARWVKVRAGLERLPRTLGRARGVVDLDEVSKQVTVDVKLTPAPDPVQVAPGVRVLIGVPSAGVASHRAYGTVQLLMDMGDAPGVVPCVLSGTSITAGKETPGLRSTVPTRVGNVMQLDLTPTLEINHADSVRLQLALESVHRSIPFEFRNLPLTGEK